MIGKRDRPDPDDILTGIDERLQHLEHHVRSIDRHVSGMGQQVSGICGALDDFMNRVHEHLRHLGDSVRTVGQNQIRLAEALGGLNERMNDMATQDDLNLIVADLRSGFTSLATSLTGIQGDLDTVLRQLADALAANQPVDLSDLAAVRDSLAAVVAQAAAIDAENPPPAG